MRNRRSAKLFTSSACMMLVVILLSLLGAFLLTSRAVSEMSAVTGAIWTTGPNGERVNGNLYTNARNVHLSGGPHMKGAADLPDGVYCFQVTDPPGKTLLSKDNLENRRFTVEKGYIISRDPGTHDSNPDTTRGYGVVIQLWPFKFDPKNRGVYKVWVTRVEHYAEGQGSFGFIPSVSKTDNFKVKVDEVPKYFELWVTDEISEPTDMEFYVYYTIDVGGEPAEPWIEGRLFHDRTENGYDIFRYETSFAMGTYVYWQFFAHRVFDTFTWTSEIYGPELIDQKGMLNKEILFIVNGHKYNYPDETGLEGWTIELYRDDELIDSTETNSDGYYEFIGSGLGDFRVCEVNKTNEGWAPFGPTCYEFTVGDNNGGDPTFDFYNYRMLPTHALTDTSDYRRELPWFKVIFTPSNEEPDRYKLSSTNPGSFYFNVVKYGTPGTPITIKFFLPPHEANGYWYDSPNFILHHTYIGSTPIVDIHVYEGRESHTGWVPDWSTDVTNDFYIDVPDEKHATVEGIMPDTGEVFVTVHIDYQISASLTAGQVNMFNTFEYIFGVKVYFSAFGITTKIDASL